MSINKIFNNFPKKKTILPIEYLNIYEKEYIINRTGGSSSNKIALFLESWMHKKIASYNNNTNSILELGAGNLNHICFEKKFNYYDIIEPFSELLKKSSHINKVNDIYSNIKEVSSSKKYDRIVSIAVLEHLLNLPEDIYYSAKLLKDDGIFLAGIPSEGSMTWGLAYKYGTGIGFNKRTSLDYEIIMRHEHVNTASEIIKVIDYFFDKVELFLFPLPIFHLSLYIVIVAKNAKIDAITSYK